jgi:hypothetical protein
MKEYLKEHMEQLNDYCKKEGLSASKIMKSPKSYNKNIMVIQHYDETKAGEGLRNNTPAKILLTIKKSKEGILFESSDDIKEYLA